MFAESFRYINVKNISSWRRVDGQIAWLDYGKFQKPISIFGAVSFPTTAKHWKTE